jgi:hypothetical protein
MAALMLAAVSVAAPAAGIAVPRAASSVVWVYKSTGAKREIPRTLEVRPSLRSATLCQSLSEYCFAGPVAKLATALFQRPPPSRPL